MVGVQLKFPNKKWSILGRGHSWDFWVVGRLMVHKGPKVNDVNPIGIESKISAFRLPTNIEVWFFPGRSSCGIPFKYQCLCINIFRFVYLFTSYVFSLYVFLLKRNIEWNLPIPLFLFSWNHIDRISRKLGTPQIRGSASLWQEAHGFQYHPSLIHCQNNDGFTKQFSTANI